MMIMQADVHFIKMLLLHFCSVDIAYLAYHCKSCLMHCEKNWQWAEWACCRPQSAGPG